jgi:hypothetical protein
MGNWLRLSFGRVTGVLLWLEDPLYTAAYSGAAMEGLAWIL